MEEKIGFFKRIKRAVVNFEGYGKFANEKQSKAVKYFFKIVLLFVLIATFAVIYPLVGQVKSGVEYLKTDMPEFEIADSKLNVNSEAPITLRNEDISLVIYIDTELAKEDRIAFFEQNSEYNNVVVFSQSEFFVKLGNTAGVISYDYKSIQDTTGLESVTKQGIIDYFNDYGYIKLFIAIFLFMFAYLYLTYIIVTLLDVLILTLLGYLTAKLYKVQLVIKQCFNIAVYALTLPILINSVYILVNSLTGFTIQHFQIMYNIISYIYVIAAILMIRVDYNKTGSDVIKIVEELKKEQENDIEINQPKEEKKKEVEEEKEDGTPEPTPGKA